LPLRGRELGRGPGVRQTDQLKLGQRRAEILQAVGVEDGEAVIDQAEERLKDGKLHLEVQRLYGRVHLPSRNDPVPEKQTGGAQDVPVDRVGPARDPVAHNDLQIREMALLINIRKV